MENLNKKIIETKNLKEIIDEQKSLKLFEIYRDKYVENLKISMGTYLKKNLKNVKTIDSLNSFNFYSLSKNYLKGKKGKEIKKVSVDNLVEEDLVLSFASHFEVLAVRRFFIQNGGDASLFANKKDFKAFEETSNFKRRYFNNEDIYYGDDLNYKTISNKQKGYKKSSIKKVENDVNKISDDFEEHEEFLNINKPTYSFENKLLDDLGTSKLSEINDFSPLLLNFIKSNKNLYIFNPPTGSGKSYSIRKAFSNFYCSEEFRNKVKRLVYFTDTRANIENESCDFLKEYSDSSTLMLHVLTNEDCILKHLDAFENLSSTFKSMKTYKFLKESVDSFLKFKKDKNINSKILEEIHKDFKVKEENFRKEIKNLLLNSFKEKGINSIEDRIDFIRNSKELSSILSVYSNILIHERKILYMTLKKGWNRIDTLIVNREINLIQDASEINKTCFIFDESDEAAVNIKDVIIDEAIEAKCDLINKTIIIADRLKNKIFPDFLEINDEFNEIIETLISKWDLYSNKYFLNYSIRIEKESDCHWLFSNKVASISSSEETELYLVKENNCVTLKRKEELIEEDISWPTFSEFSKDILNYYYELCRFIKSLSNIHKEKYVDISLSDSIRSVLNWFGISDDDKRKESLVRDISFISRDEIAFMEYCGYENPGIFSKLESSDDNNLFVKLYSYSINRTPEKVLLHLLSNGAKVILSSATAENKSVLKNFDLDWEKFDKYKYVPSNEEKLLEEDFLQRNQKYQANLNLKVCKTKGNSKDLVKSILGYFEEDKRIYIEELIEESKSVFISSKRGSKNTECLKADVINNYYFLEYLKLVDFLLDCKSNGLKSTLVFYPFICDEVKDSCLFQCLLEIVKLLKVKGINQTNIFCVSSSNMKEKSEEFKISVKNNNFSVFLTSYQTANKGLNLQVEMNVNLNDLIAINDRGVAKLEELKNESIDDMCLVKVDIEGLFISNITHILPDLKIEEDSKEDSEKNSYDKKVISCLLMVVSLFESGNIDEVKFNELITRILNKEQYPFPINEFKNHKVYLDKLFAFLQQTIGRICREILKMKSTIIYIDNLICDNVLESGIDRTFIYDDYTYNKQPKEIKGVIDLLFSSTKKVGKKKNFKESIDIINNFLDGISRGDGDIIKSYIDFRQNVKKLFLTEEEFKDIKKINEKVSKFYTLISGEDYKNGYSYNCDLFDLYGNEIVDFIFPGDKVSFKSLFLDDLDLDLKDKIFENFDLSYSEDSKYILNPKGFETLKGAIGEFIGDYYFKNYLKLNLNDLPFEIFERMDAIKEYDDFVLVVDYKNYNSIIKNLDDKETKKKLEFTNKLQQIQNFYKGKKVCGIVLNTRNNKDKNLYKMKKHFLTENIDVLTVPNIYLNDGSFDLDICLNIFKYINDGGNL